MPEVSFESLLGHFNSFCASVELGGRPLHKTKQGPTNGLWSLETTVRLCFQTRFAGHSLETYGRGGAACESWLSQVKLYNLKVDAWRPQRPLFPVRQGNLGPCGFFAYSWKLPAYSGACLLTVDNFSFFAYS